MLLGETVAVAFQSIRANALRSVLTMLGIIIGVGAVITMVALGTGAQKAVNDRIAALGANVFSVMAGQASFGGVRITDRTILSTDDYEALLRDATLLKAVVPEMQQSLQVKYGNQNSNVNVVGTTPNYVEVKNYTVPYGRMFTDRRRRRPPALRGARRRRAPDAQRQPGGDDPPDAADSRHSVRDHRRARARRARPAGSATPTSRFSFPLRHRSVSGVRQQAAAHALDPGGRRRADAAGNGRPRAGPPARASHPAGRRERLHHPQPAGRPRHAAAGDAGLHQPARERRGGEPASSAASAS